MSFLANYLRGAGALTTQAVVQRVLGAVTSIILARGLGASAFGAYSAVINTANSAFFLARLGVDGALHVYSARSANDREARTETGELLGAGLYLLSATGIVAGILVAMAAPWIAAGVFGQPELAGPLAFAGALTTLQCLSQFSYATLSGLQEFVAYARAMIVNALLAILLAVAGLYLYGLTGALGGYGIAQAFLAAALGREVIQALRRHGLQVARTRFARSMQALMRLGFPFYVSGLLVVPITFYAQGLLSRSSGLDALGILRVAGTITAIVSFVPLSIAAVTTSALTRARSTDGSSAKVMGYALLNIKVVWYSTTVVAVTLAAAAPWLVELLFGSEYRAAVDPSTVAVFSTVLSSTTVAAGSLFLAIERSSVVLGQALLQTLFMGVGSFLLIPATGVLGYVGAEFVANLVALAFVLAAALRLSQGEWKDTRWLPFFSISFAAIVTLALVVLATPAGYARNLFLAAILGVSTVSLYRFGLSAIELAQLGAALNALRAKRGAAGGPG